MARLSTAHAPAKSFLILTANTRWPRIAVGAGRLRPRSRFLPHHRAFESDPEIIIDTGFAFVKFERARACAPLLLWARQSFSKMPQQLCFLLNLTPAIWYEPQSFALIPPSVAGGSVRSFNQVKVWPLTCCAPPGRVCGSPECSGDTELLFPHQSLKEHTWPQSNLHWGINLHFHYS